MRHAFFIAATLLASTAVADAQDARTRFLRDVDDCMRNEASKGDPAAARQECLRDAARYHISTKYARAARDRVFFDFGSEIGDEDDNLAPIVSSAMSWDDVARPGPDSREFLLWIMDNRNATTSEGAPQVKFVARLRRSKDESVSFQIDEHVRSGFDPERDLKPLYALNAADFFAAIEKKLPTTDAVTSSLRIEELRTDETACPALAEIVRKLWTLKWPNPGNQGSQQGGLKHIVIHPRVVTVQVRDYPISLTIEDNSMSTEPFHWTMDSMQALEPCWRPQK